MRERDGGQDTNDLKSQVMRHFIAVLASQAYIKNVFAHARKMTERGAKPERRVER